MLIQCSATHAEHPYSLYRDGSTFRLFIDGELYSSTDLAFLRSLI